MRYDYSVRVALLIVNPQLARGSPGFVDLVLAEVECGAHLLGGPVQLIIQGRGVRSLETGSRTPAARAGLRRRGPRETHRPAPALVAVPGAAQPRGGSAAVARGDRRRRSGTRWPGLQPHVVPAGSAACGS